VLAALGNKLPTMIKRIINWLSRLKIKSIKLGPVTFDVNDQNQHIKADSRENVVQIEDDKNNKIGDRRRFAKLAFKLALSLTIAPLLLAPFTGLGGNLSLLVYFLATLLFWTGLVAWSICILLFIWGR
jgi:hypothetical protein